MAKVLSAYDMVEALFGVEVTPNINPVISSIGVTAGKVLKSNPNRVAFVIYNHSVNSVYISPKGDVSSTNGMLVAANGGSVTLSFDKDLTLPCLEWWIIATGAGSNFFIMESIINPGGK